MEIFAYTPLLLMNVTKLARAMVNVLEELLEWISPTGRQVMLLALSAVSARIVH